MSAFRAAAAVHRLHPLRRRRRDQVSARLCTHGDGGREDPARTWAARADPWSEIDKTTTREPSRNSWRRARSRCTRTIRSACTRWCDRAALHRMADKYPTVDAPPERSRRSAGAAAPCCAGSPLQWRRRRLQSSARAGRLQITARHVSSASTRGRPAAAIHGRGGTAAATSTLPTRLGLRRRRDHRRAHPRRGDLDVVVGAADGGDAWRAWRWSTALAAAPSARPLLMVSKYSSPRAPEASKSAIPAGASHAVPQSWRARRSLFALVNGGSSVGRSPGSSLRHRPPRRRRRRDRRAKASRHPPAATVRDYSFKGRVRRALLFATSSRRAPRGSGRQARRRPLRARGSQSSWATPTTTTTRRK